jgi:hypothetical protein
VQHDDADQNDCSADFGSSYFCRMSQRSNPRLVTAMNLGSRGAQCVRACIRATSPSPARQLSASRGAVRADDDLAVGSFKDDPFDGGLPFAHGDREFVPAEPLGQPINVAAQLQPRDLD